MKFKLIDPYRSLNPFESEELHPFTVITGKNGSGKTQLLEILENKISGKAEYRQFQFETDPPIRRIQVEGIVKESASTLDLNSWRALITPALHRYMGMSVLTKRLFGYMWQKDIRYKKRDPLSANEFLSNDPEYLQLIRKLIVEKLGQGGEFNPWNENEVLAVTFPDAEAWVFPYIAEVAGLSRKSFEALEANDFYKVPISERFLDRIGLFNSQFEIIFYNYAKRRHENRQNYFFQKEEGHELGAVSDHEFVKQHTPPWKIINAILSDSGVDFEFQEIKTTDFRPDLQQEFKLIKLSSGIPIEFSHLSSGEKVIIGLVIKLFTSQYYEDYLEFPELLILDEPDAHLHPEMTQLLLNVLEGTFVEKLGMHVIITTHSPSTVALASEASLYELTNQPVTALKKIAKDDALKILTGFLPTLTIDYKNHRQVFVESPTDMNYYQSLLTRHAQEKALMFKLYFVANSMGKGNSDVVYDLVKQIRTSGNGTSYGIVDWDLKNTEKDFVYVHGMAERYSIENYLLDPIYLVAVLLSRGNPNGIRQKTELLENENEYNLGHKSQEDVQKIVDTIFEIIREKYPALVDKSTLTNIPYLNGHVIQWPTSYCEAQGHEIVTKLKILFPAFTRFRNEGELQDDLTSVMVKSYPFIPQSSIEILERIAVPVPAPKPRPVVQQIEDSKGLSDVAPNRRFEPTK